MSREIKFRVWDTKYKMMLPFDDLNLVLNSYGVFERHTKDYAGDYYCLTDQYVLMQYTGLKDKNGNEIYEGDIVNYMADYQNGLPLFVPAEVYFNEKWGQWRIADRFNDCEDALCEIDKEDLYVIGNIHENPELMENVK